jgi:hypothetical protein
MIDKLKTLLIVIADGTVCVMCLKDKKWIAFTIWTLNLIFWLGVLVKEIFFDE